MVGCHQTDLRRGTTHPHDVWANPRTVDHVEEEEIGPVSAKISKGFVKDTRE